MKRTALIFVTALLAAASVSDTVAGPVRPPVWEQIQTGVQSASDDADRVDVTAKEGYIYVTVSRPVTVRIYSILGQLVAQQNVQPGVTRVKIGTRGVFILKAGQITRRVTV